jgi:hypothetical protein
LYGRAFSNNPAEYSTLEVGGDESVLKSYAYLKSLGAE